MLLAKRLQPTIRTQRLRTLGRRCRHRPSRGDGAFKGLQRLRARDRIKSPAEIDPCVRKKKTRRQVSADEQNRDHWKGMALFFFAHLAIERKIHLTLLPPTKFAPDEDRHGSHATQSLLERCGPWKAGCEPVSIKECCDA